MVLLGSFCERRSCYQWAPRESIRPPRPTLRLTACRGCSTVREAAPPSRLAPKGAHTTRRLATLIALLAFALPGCKSSQQGGTTSAPVANKEEVSRRVSEYFGKSVTPGVVLRVTD